MSLDIATAEAARFWYRATYVTNYDGDTLDVELDLGFHLRWTTRIRMLGINAPELRGKTRPAAVRSRDFLERLLKGYTFYVRTHRDSPDKYGGRWLGEIFAPIADGGDPDKAHIVDDPVDAEPLTSVNLLMVQHGFAVPYDP